MEIQTTLFFTFLMLAASVEAACKKSWVCDDYGRNCKLQQICGSTLDIPDVGIAPIKPLPSMKIKPLPSLDLPPLGTKKCEYKQVNGIWQNVCS